MAYNTGTYVLFDAASAGALTTADNALTINPAGNVQWGGTLIQGTVIFTDTFDWAFAADNAGTPRTALGFDYSLSAMYFGSPAGNYAITGEWYLSPTGQAGYLRFNTFDASDTAIEIGVDAANNSQVRLYDGAATLGIDIGKTAANNWGVTIGNDTNQAGKVTTFSYLGSSHLEFKTLTTTAGLISAAARIFGKGFAAYDDGVVCTINAGSYTTPGVLYMALGNIGLELTNNITHGSPGNAIQLGCKDFVAGTTILTMATEGTPVQAAAVTNTHNVPIEINGITYYIMLSNAR